MYITKENVNKIVEKLQLKNFIVYVDMKFFLKDICNPYHTSDLRYMNELDLHKYFLDLHNYMTKFFNSPVYFVYSTKKIEIEGIPSYKEEYYSKYFDDEERGEILSTIKKVFNVLKYSSVMLDTYKFFDSSEEPYMDELQFIKSHHKFLKALVITRDKAFKGYSDIITLNPYDLITGEIKTNEVPDYYKIILSIIGYPRYSLPGIPGIKEKTAQKIIKRLLDKGEYIYYNDTSDAQKIFPISYETLAEISDITKKEYDQILLNWKFFNL